MKTSFRIIFLIILAVGPISCLSGRFGQQDVSSQVASLLDASSDDVASQNFDAAMDKALQALDLSAGEPQLHVQALTTIVGIDIMASRDADAWEKALQAEALARKQGYKKELASKAKLLPLNKAAFEKGLEIGRSQK